MTLITVNDAAERFQHDARFFRAAGKLKYLTLKKLKPFLFDLDEVENWMRSIGTDELWKIDAFIKKKRTPPSAGRPGRKPKSGILNKKE